MEKLTAEQEKAKAEMQLAIEEYEKKYLQDNWGNFEIDKEETSYCSFRIGWYNQHHFVIKIEKVCLE